MARPMKQGLDYFPLDVDFFEDEKIEYVTARFGEKGELLVIKLLCDIYRNGYSTKWNEDKATIFAKRAGNNISPSLVNDVVEELVKRDFFEKSIFNSFDILTSKGVQKRYLQATAERKEVELIEYIWLLDFPEDTKKTRYIINRPINGVNPPINAINPPINSQRKVKESKVKDKKIYVRPDGERLRDSKNNQIDELFESLWALYPVKRGKQKVSKKAKEAIYKIGFDEFKRAIDRYISEKNRTGYNVANGSTFFNSDYVEFLDANYQAMPESKIPQNKSAQTKLNRFANFPQRKWDFDKLEKVAREELNRDSSKSEVY